LSSSAEQELELLETRLVKKREKLVNIVVERQIIEV